MQASRGAVKVTIISAEALKKKQLDTIQAGIVSMVGAGKTVRVLGNSVLLFSHLLTAHGHCCVL